MVSNHPTIESSNHQSFMLRALELARTNLGQTWPNPAVGAVIVKDGKIIGEGFTAPGGRPHAETLALKQAGVDARGATIYVSLEPCAHQGKTPPCVDAIIAAGIATCVVACGDPNPPVNGKGIAKLKESGIEVIENICKDEARELNRGFISVVEQKRPYVMLKIATSADGKIAGGEGGWITGEKSRKEVHRLRSEFDAVLTGIGTVLADNPLLTVRTPGLEHKSPLRIILDRNCRLPSDSKLATSTEISPVWVLNSKTIEEALMQIADKGITRLMVEAGQKINTAFLKSGLVDRIYWFKSPEIIGKDGLSAVSGELSEMLADYKKLSETAAFGNDSLDIFEKQCSPAS